MRSGTQQSRGLRKRVQSRSPKQLLLRITMAGIAPPIWRLIRVPDRFSLHQLHRTLQIAFSRLDYHLYAFEVRGRRYEAPSADSEENDASAIALCDLTLSEGFRFTYVYDFGDCWEHEIVVEASLPMPSENGPDWSPRLLAGERAAPPEDSGGASGFMEVIAALNDPSNPRHKEIRDWVGSAYDQNKFDAWAMDHALALAVAWGAI
ncbi:MAG: plasmid pRiA4b ORF-3 family protein [Burkholderiales bacterium]